MSNDQKPYENVTRVFWIKIELKENSPNGRHIYGEIKDVISSEKSVIKDLFDIISFMIPYMQKMGIKVHWFWQLANRMKGNNKLT